MSWGSLSSREACATAGSCVAHDLLRLRAYRPQKRCETSLRALETHRLWL